MLRETSIKVDQAAPGTFQLGAATPQTIHQVLGFMLWMSAAGTWKFTDSGGDLSGAISVIKDAPPIIYVSPGLPIVSSARGSALNLVTTGGAAKGVVLLMSEWPD